MTGMAGFDQMLKMATSGLSDAAKDMQSNVYWDGVEFDNFDEALKFVRKNKFLAVQFLQYKDKICMFFAKGDK